jgi:hypothetical protein
MLSLRDGMRGAPGSQISSARRCSEWSPAGAAVATSNRTASDQRLHSLHLSGPASASQ